jgi:hypothetical protein
LTATDVASGWICLFSLLNKVHRWTFDVLKDIYAGLPFPLREFHGDNGSEFINHVVTDWHRNPARSIPFTRSRDHKKNDSRFVEQKKRRRRPCHPRVAGSRCRPVPFFATESGGPGILGEFPGKPGGFPRPDVCPRHGTRKGLKRYPFARFKVDGQKIQA